MSAAPSAEAPGTSPVTEREAALVSWSALAEPGDPLAHALVDVLGPSEALAWVRLAADDPVAATMGLAPRAKPSLVDQAVAAVARWVPRLEAADPAGHLGRASRLGAYAIPRGARGWPTALDDLGAAAPYCLWVRGAVAPEAALSRAIAIVGSRSSTAYGEHVAASIASGLADEGWATVSGGAYGIDARAHRGSLAAGGVTVAVLAGGIDHLYPRGNADLLERVLETGAVIAEQPPGFPPHRSRFLTRNRIIAAAAATVVVEAAWRSGALSTATHAAEIGRPVACRTRAGDEPLVGGMPSADPQRGDVRDLATRTSSNSSFPSTRRARKARKARAGDEGSASSRRRRSGGRTTRSRGAEARRRRWPVRPASRRRRRGRPSRASRSREP